MREFIQFENMTIEIWRRPRQRRMHLTVREDGRVRVTCNRGKPRREVLGFVADNRAFIAKRTLEIERVKERFPTKQALSGETYLLFGERRPLNVVWSWDRRARVTSTDGELELLVSVGCSAAERGEALGKFYRALGKGHLARRTAELARQTGLIPTSVAVRGQRTRWGSCSSGGQISLNWKLTAAPPFVIDYVIIHELAHLRHMNHSANFWGLVAEHYPDYRAAVSWLKEFEPEINAQFEGFTRAAPP